MLIIIYQKPLNSYQTGQEPSQTGILIPFSKQGGAYPDHGGAFHDGSF